MGAGTARIPDNLRNSNTDQSVVAPQQPEPQTETITPAAQGLQRDESKTNIQAPTQTLDATRHKQLAESKIGQPVVDNQQIRDQQARAQQQQTANMQTQHSADNMANARAQQNMAQQMTGAANQFSATQEQQRMKNEMDNVNSNTQKQDAQQLAATHANQDLALEHQIANNQQQQARLDQDLARDAQTYSDIERAQVQELYDQAVANEDWQTMQQLVEQYGDVLQGKNVGFQYMNNLHNQIRSDVELLTNQIADLAGSTNPADYARRRELEKQLETLKAQENDIWNKINRQEWGENPWEWEYQRMETIPADKFVTEFDEVIGNGINNLNQFLSMNTMSSEALRGAISNAFGIQDMSMSGLMSALNSGNIEPNDFHDIGLLATAMQIIDTSSEVDRNLLLQNEDLKRVAERFGLYDTMYQKHHQELAVTNEPEQADETALDPFRRLNIRDMDTNDRIESWNSLPEGTMLDRDGQPVREGGVISAQQATQLARGLDQLQVTISRMGNNTDSVKAGRQATLDFINNMPEALRVELFGTANPDISSQSRNSWTNGQKERTRNDTADLLRKIQSFLGGN